MTIIKLITAGGNASYDSVWKEYFRKESMKFLRAVAKHLGLARGTFDVRFNPGGIAVSGDAILHTDTFYICITGTGAYWRHCAGRKDYVGEYNRRMGSDDTAKDLADTIRDSFAKN